ncbi:hypothetical protein [Streptomyces sp. KL116D]|uniref:hypothetical protein n=1 Tax=Streptomyces sp. KL116D TaxID=3045152 RepID=UPI0035573E44
MVIPLRHRRLSERLARVAGYEQTVTEVEVEHEKVRRRESPGGDLKLLADLLPKAKVAPARLPESLKATALQLAWALSTYLTESEPTPGEGKAGRRERLERRRDADRDLTAIVAATYAALEKYKTTGR